LFLGKLEGNAGRLAGVLRRPGYEIDVENILKVCARQDVAVEINANPWRLDLDWRWHRMALDLGCMMSINPDAHSISEIDLTHWGVEMARKGAVPKERVLNCIAPGRIRELPAGTYQTTVRRSFTARTNDKYRVRMQARIKRLPAQ
jgi:hypothetical protein